MTRRCPAAEPPAPAVGIESIDLREEIMIRRAEQSLSAVIPEPVWQVPRSCYYAVDAKEMNADTRLRHGDGGDRRRSGSATATKVEHARTAEKPAASCV